MARATMAAAVACLVAAPAWAQAVTVTPDTRAADHGRSFGSHSAPIAIMGPSLRRQLGDFKLVGSMGSPAATSTSRAPPGPSSTTAP